MGGLVVRAPPADERGAAAPAPAVMMRRAMDASIPSATARPAALDLGSPAFPAAVVTVLAWVVWGGLDGGFSPTVWGSVGAGLVLLLGIALAAIPHSLDLSERARAVTIAGLVGLCAWSFASILWADFPGDAWAGSAMTLAYAAGFLLLSLWPSTPRAATLLLAIFTAGVVVLGALTLVGAAGQVDGASRWFVEGRLFEPVGYPNGTVALWMSALWPALALAANRGLPVAARALALGSAGFLLDLAVLGQSRGWLIFFPLSLAVALLLTRQRLRLLVAASLATLSTLAIVAPLLDVFDTFGEGGTGGSAVVRAAWLIGVSAGVLTLTGAAWAALDRRVVLSPSAHRALAGVASAAVLLVCVGGTVGALAVAEHPGRWVSERWEEFRGGSSLDAEGSRFTSSASSGRYEEWTIAWGAFLDHPLTGIGADNFAATYLEERGNDFREPRFPHSFELKVASQLGLVGLALFLTFAVGAVLLALRRRRALGAAEASIVGAALMIPAWWAIAGSADWFWELPALAGPAFGFLGLAGAVRPPAAAAETGPPPDESPPKPDAPSGGESTPDEADAGAAAGEGNGRPPSRRRLVVVSVGLVTGVAVLAGAASLAVPALAERYTRAGVEVWRDDLGLAYARLDRAASLNPLAGGPLLLKGSIALRAKDLDEAETAFRAALEREPTSWYANLQLALIAAAQGESEKAWAWLRRAQELNPNDKVARRLQTLLERGKPVDPDELNDRYVRSFNQRQLGALRSPIDGVR